jgi:hypothetical protein
MRRITLVVLMILFFSYLLKAQNADTAEAFTKKGWNFGMLPAVSFNSDLGFQYGGLINFFHYGDGSRYPSYDHSFYLEVSHYTKGSGLFRFAVTLRPKASCRYKIIILYHRAATLQVC